MVHSLRGSLAPPYSHVFGTKILPEFGLSAPLFHAFTGTDWGLKPHHQTMLKFSFQSNVPFSFLFKTESREKTHQSMSISGDFKKVLMANFLNRCLRSQPRQTLLNLTLENNKEVFVVWRPGQLLLQKSCRSAGS